MHKPSTQIPKAFHQHGQAECDNRNLISDPGKFLQIYALLKQICE